MIKHSVAQNHQLMFQVKELNPILLPMFFFFGSSLHGNSHPVVISIWQFCEVAGNCLMSAGHFIFYLFSMPIHAFTDAYVLHFSVCQHELNGH